MPLIKTQIQDNFVLNFLAQKYKTNSIFLSSIKGGEFSQAYRFDLTGVSRVIRFNTTSQEGFVKDKFAHELFSKINLPIPEIMEIGKVGEYNYAISEYVPGKTLDNLTFEENTLIIPELFADLIKINNIPPMGTGYGTWRVSDLNAPHATAKDWVLDNLKPAKWPQIKASEPYFDLDLITTLQTKIVNLIPFIPEKRQLVHGDYGFSNVLSDGKIITGIIDWTESLYGDFVYDIAWLQFWSAKIDYLALFPRYNRTFDLTNYQERSTLYMLLNGLWSMEIFAESHREKDYHECIDILKKHELI